jgi:RNA polymerase sigma-70 factor, ECF subfamily
LNLNVPACDYMPGKMDKAPDRLIDELLVMRCQEGSRESFDLLIRRWQPPLWRYARALTGNNDAAWDVTQESWMAMVQQIRELSDPAWFTVWAYRIVRNKCADYCRRSDRRRRLADASLERQRAQCDRLQEGTSEAVVGALWQLPREARELVTLKYRADLNIVEIAVILGIPAGTVKSRLHHAREQLRRILEGDES